MVKRFVIRLLLPAIFFCNADAVSQNNSPAGTVTGKVIDNETGEPLAARIILKNEKGQVTESFYENLPGFFTAVDGSFTKTLAPGKYEYSVHHGIDYLSSSGSVLVRAGTNHDLEISLKPWFPLRKKGWVNGDGHDHLYTNIKYDSSMLDTVLQVCLAQGIDFMCTSQGWAGFNDSNWRSGYSKYNSAKFLLHYGSEMPKYRTGHTWWIGQTTTRGIFESSMDTTYENHYYQVEQGKSWTFDSLAFPQIPDVEVVQRFRKYDSALAVIAHPTSWWWQKRGNTEKYVTNVAAYIPFGLLAGKLWDAQVVMGYNRDHYYYQDLWFNMLNLGYKITPVSELDGGYNRGDKFYYGSMRTYYKVGNDLNISGIKEAIRHGNTFVTSGPILMANVDEKYEMGQTIPANGIAHTINVDARASGDKDDYLSYLVIFRNGKIHQLWDLRKEKLRKLSRKITVIESDNAWYVIKLYGRRAWSDPAALDVLAYNAGKVIVERDTIGTNSDVAIGSPFYFRKEGYSEPLPLISKIDLNILDQEGKNYRGEIKIEIVNAGEVIRTLVVNDGRGKFEMPVQCILRITPEGKDPVYRSLYADYRPYRNIMERLASGKWLDRADRKYGPGEVPWSAFSFDETKKVLSQVSWNITLSPNERDALWQPFDRVFTAK